MRKIGFYPKLAAQSIRRNGKFTLPYFLSCIFTAAMFYDLVFLSANRGVDQMRGGNYVRTLLVLGAVVVAIFSCILLFYTNSFLMKRRQKELGLYNILGMEKRHIALVMVWETVYTALIGVIGGVLVGILLSKLLLLLLCALMQYTVPFGFEVSLPAVLLTAVGFSVIFFLNLLANLRRVGKAKPIELLYAGNAGEREPKTRGLLVLLGLVTLLGGYYLAITVESPLKALALFFVAVLLVIVGTYCLFTSGSIALLKLLRKNKNYYYKTKHFTAISGMLHRMKRNAAGLASVCILSTMVLVTVSTTVCLYLGTAEVLHTLYPREAGIYLHGTTEEAMVDMQEAMEAAAKKEGVELTNVGCVCYYENYSEDSVSINLNALMENYAGGVMGTKSYPEDLPGAYVGADFVNDEDAESFCDLLWDVMDSNSITFTSGRVDDGIESSGEFYGMLGGFFFLGLFLGLLFLMATVLIIYYKQVSEGYEDAERFKIMQQVGMSQKEVRTAIQSQVLTVFFLPLIAAAVHVAAAFNMIAKLLAIFGLNNVGLFALCCLATLVIFALMYGLIYLVTARAYYRIVRV